MAEDRTDEGGSASGTFLGRVAYEAYVRHCGGKSVRGDDLPTWDGQAPEIRAHWAAAALAVVASDG